MLLGLHRPFGRHSGPGHRYGMRMWAGEAHGSQRAIQGGPSQHTQQVVNDARLRALPTQSVDARRCGRIAIAGAAGPRGLPPASLQLDGLTGSRPACSPEPRLRRRVRPAPSTQRHPDACRHPAPPLGCPPAAGHPPPPATAATASQRVNFTSCCPMPRLAAVELPIDIVSHPGVPHVRHQRRQGSHGGAAGGHQQPSL